MSITTALIITIILLLVLLSFLGFLLLSIRSKLNNKIEELTDLYNQTVDQANRNITELQNLHQSDKKRLKDKHLEEINELNKKIRSLASTPEQKVSQEFQASLTKKQKEAFNEAEDIIKQAEITAESIISEANERSEIMIERRYKQLNQEIVKLVIKIVDEVLNKTLTNEEHKDLILKSFERLK